MTRHRWIGIDEAGYGPNLGPLVMVAIVAESRDGREPDLWADLPHAISRARGRADRLWVDDSKAILKGGKGRDRLNQAAFATLLAAGRTQPATFSAWLEALGAGSFDDVELTPWLVPGSDPAIAVGPLTIPPIAHNDWSIVSVRAIVVGPRQFNMDIEQTNSKASAHFRAFARLLGPLWDDVDVPTLARCDKHGGRNFYLGPLSDSFPNVWIDRGEEGPNLSRYTLREPNKCLTLEFRPRADSESALVALASITAKAIREVWMDAFNAFWEQRLPGLKPTAGYPVDAWRFRREIGPTTETLGLAPNLWWRTR